MAIIKDIDYNDCCVKITSNNILTEINLFDKDENNLGCFITSTSHLYNGPAKAIKNRVLDYAKILFEQK